MEELVKSLLAQGPLGLLCAALVFAIAKLWKRYEASQVQRAEDALLWQKILRDNTEAINDLNDSHKNIATVIDSLSEANRNNTEAVRQHTEALERSRRS